MRETKTSMRDQKTGPMRYLVRSIDEEALLKSFRRDCNSTRKRGNICKSLCVGFVNLYG